MTMCVYFGKFSFFFFREDSTNRHPKENPLNLEEDFEVGPTELKADLANQAR